MWIALSNGSKDGFAVQISRLRTAATLEVMRNSACRDKGDVAEWTFYVFAHVDARPEMLNSNGVNVNKGSRTLGECQYSTIFSAFALVNRR